MKLRCSLTKAGDIDNLIKSLEQYRDTLDNKVDMFLSRLLNIGIETAKSFSGEYERFITFKKEINNGEALMIATDGQKIIKEWYTDKKLTHKRGYEISPLLMAEFGSGWLAVVLSDIGGVGQGTMPNSYGHAGDPDGWYWYDETGYKHHSIGEAPTFPMNNAFIAMQNEIDSVAKKVFK